MKLTLPEPGSMIGGQTVFFGEEFDCINPATGETITKLREASKEVVESAVDSASEAMKGPWASMSLGRRQKLLEKLADLIEADKDYLCSLESIENGIPISVVRGFSVAALIKNLRYYAGWIDKMPGEVIPLTSSSGFDYVVNVPYGVVAVITAYNTPSLFIGSKACAALSAGNCVIIKPSPLASLPALHFSKLAKEAGFPEGVVNVVVGGNSTGKALVSNPGVDFISFTGSRSAGKEVGLLASSNLTPVLLELGGKSPNIVFEDADLNKAALGSAVGGFALSGQACVAGSRLYVQRSVYHEFVEKFVNATDILRVGDPKNEGTVLGPLISQEQRQKVEDAIQKGKDEGAEAICGGDRPGGDLSSGFYLNPCILKVEDGNFLTRDELFGPVVTVSTFNDQDEVVEKANNSRYGLGAGIWTKDLSRAHKMASILRAGTVWINTYGPVPHTAPFGGFHDSGHGREGGRWGFETFLTTKNVYMEIG